MDAYQSIMARRSVRSYKKEIPPKELVMKVVDAGRHAPSGMNTQKWHFTVVMNKEKIKEIGDYVLGEGKSICYDAPVFIMVSYEKDDFFSKEDTSCALVNMMQAANALGLGSVWINAINRNDEKASNMTAFSVPSGYRVYGCLALGYPDGEVRKRDVKPQSETVSIIE